VHCALSNSAAFDDLEWPQTPVSRSQYSLKVNISQTGASDSLRVCSEARIFGIGRSNGAICGSIKSKMAGLAADGHLGYTTMAISLQPVFGIGQSNDATFNDLESPKPQFQGHSIVQRRISRKRCMLRPNISSALFVYDGCVCRQHTYIIQMTQTSRGPSATAELVVISEQSWVCEYSSPSWRFLYREPQWIAPQNLHHQKLEWVPALHFCLWQ